MFNLKKYAGNDDIDLLSKEIAIYNIIPETNGYKMGLGDECVHLKSLDECLEYIGEGIDEIRSELWKSWKLIANICEEILNRKDENRGNLDNIVFLSSARNAYLFSKQFSDLEDFSRLLRHLLDIDIMNVDSDLVAEFNKAYLKIKLMHRLIMSEKYRTAIIKRYLKIKKIAQISGPWANLDLPMQERVWPYAEDEEYFEHRKKARREQARYNPENTADGFYYIWQDRNRDPYLFRDMKTDSPYKSRHLITIP